ncbi:hypothetical protein [Moraxella lacunata]|uniref:hypothetical protein n=1 Tax=Moraxella lacunata TaxID=477 RepID=UPI003EE211A9
MGLQVIFMRSVYRRFKIIYNRFCRLFGFIKIIYLFIGYIRLFYEKTKQAWQNRPNIRPISNPTIRLCNQCIVRKGLRRYLHHHPKESTHQ